MSYTQCVLDSLTYATNPVENQNPLVRKIAVVEGLSGNLYTDWGQATSRREVLQTWPVLSAAQFEALKAKAAILGPLSFTDDDGTSYSVLVEAPTYQRKTPGGVAYMGVSFKLYIVS